MIVAWLLACGGPGVDDVGGDWYGTFSHEGADPWTVRMFDVSYVGTLDATSDRQGLWREWTGTFELWGSYDAGTVEPWFNDPVGVEVVDIQVPLVFWVCEDDLGCTNVDDSYGPHGYLISAFAGGPAVFVNAGTIDESQIWWPLSGVATWTGGDDITIDGTAAFAPAYAGLALGDPP